MPLKKEGRTGRPARPFRCLRENRFFVAVWLRPLKYAILTKYVCGGKHPSVKRDVSNLINRIIGSRAITLCKLIEIIAALKHIESRFR